jgi:DNA-binding SARP family transcriptional activator
VLELRILGEFSLIDEHRGLRLTGSRAVELLAYLALHAGTEVPRQVVAGALWPESGDGQALTNLRRELHQLKGHLGPARCLDAGNGTLSWRDDSGCLADVRAFRGGRAAALAATGREDPAEVLTQLTRALDAYRGDLLPGCYADWAQTERDALRAECIGLCDAATDLLRRRGELARAEALAQRRIGLDPLAETGYRQLIGIQAARGDRGAALHTYHRCATILERDLGVGPDPATRALVDRLVPPPSAASRPTGSPASGPPVSLGPPLVGRAGELTAARRRWDAALHGTTGLLLVSGGPGVGKSRLVEELAAFVRGTGAAVATARCFSTPGRTPLAPVAGWLRAPPFQEAVRSLPEAWRTEVARLLPELAPGAPVPAPGTERALVDVWQRQHFFEALARGITTPDRPVLLVLDDLQWCDAESAEWLGRLLAEPPAGPLLVAATWRTGSTGGGPAVRHLLEGLSAARLVSEIRLEPLAGRETLALVRQVGSRGVTDREADILQAATGGYPLFVIAAARSLDGGWAPGQATGPVAMRRILDDRLGQCSPEARGVAALSAAYGHDIGLDLLREAGDLEDGALAEAVDELWAARILRPHGQDGYLFSHELVRSAVYDGITPARRWLLHRRLAQGLELLHAGHLDAVAAPLAEQYRLGGRPDRALEFSALAARVAAGVFANGEALRHYGACLDLVARDTAGPARDEQELSILRSMTPAQIAVHGYASAELLATLDRAAELSQRLGRSDVLHDCLIGLFANRFVRGQTQEAYRTGSRALALAQGASRPDADQLVQSHFAVAGAALSLGRLEESLEAFAACRDTQAGGYSSILGTKPAVHAQGWSAHAHWLTGDGQTARALLQDADVRAREAGHPYTLAVILGYTAILAQLDAHPEAARAAAGELIDLCHRYGFTYYDQWGTILQGWAEGGERGTEQIRAGIRALQDQNALARMPYWLSLLATTLADAGERGPARSVLDAALAAAEQCDDRWWLPEVLRLRAVLGPPRERARLMVRARDLALAQHSLVLAARCGD